MFEYREISILTGIDRRYKFYLLRLAITVSPFQMYAEIGNAASYYYGNPQIMTSLADTQIGDVGDVSYANTVVFPVSKTLVSFRKYFKFVPGEKGGRGYYHGGDGGTISFSLQTDDGTNKHNPSGEVIAKTGDIIGGPPEPDGTGGLYDGEWPPSGAPGAIYGCDTTDDANFREICFEQPFAVKSGEIYHLVAESTGNNPEKNFVSMNDIHVRNTSGSRAIQAPVYSDLDYRVGYKHKGEWIYRTEYIAIVEYIFDDGTTWGNGYMEVSPTKDSPSVRATKWVNSKQDIRQTFTPRESFTACSLYVAAMNFDGENSLNAIIADAFGSVLWAGLLDGYPTGVLVGKPGRWSEFEATMQSRFRGVMFDRPFEVEAHKAYEITLRSAGGSHVIPGIRDGSDSNGYFGSSTTVDGAAYYRDADRNRWVAWGIDWPGASSRIGGFDISFYLGVRASDATHCN